MLNVGQIAHSTPLVVEVIVNKILGGKASIYRDDIHYVCSFKKTLRVLWAVEG